MRDRFCSGISGTTSKYVPPAMQELIIRARPPSADTRHTLIQEVKVDQPVNHRAMKNMCSSRQIAQANQVWCLQTSDMRIRPLKLNKIFKHHTPSWGVATCGHQAFTSGWCDFVILHV